MEVGGGEEVGAELIPLDEFLAELLNSFHKISLSGNCSSIRRRALPPLPAPPPGAFPCDGLAIR